MAKNYDAKITGFKTEQLLNREVEEIESISLMSEEENERIRDYRNVVIELDNGNLLYIGGMINSIKITTPELVKKYLTEQKVKQESKTKEYEDAIKKF
jgi:hypothetical protein